MRIKVERGVSLRIDDTRHASTRGCEIEIGEVSAEDRARILATPGVSEVNEVPETAAEAAEAVE